MKQISEETYIMYYESNNTKHYVSDFYTHSISHSETPNGAMRFKSREEAQLAYKLLLYRNTESERKYKVSRMQVVTEDVDILKEEEE